MAIHANSTPVPERLLLRAAAAPGRLLPAGQLTSGQRAELLAILDAGPITPEDLTHLSRQRRESTLLGVEALIDLLDALDAAGADLEDGADDEPSLGSPEAGFCLDYATSRIVRGGTLNQERWAIGSRADECEVVSEDEGACISSQPHDGDGEDKEPSLGWTEAQSLDQRWTWGFQHGDAEEDGWRRPRRRPSQSPVSAPLPDRIGNIRVIGFVQ